jgi:hypothetical protein
VLHDSIYYYLAARLLVFLSRAGLFLQAVCLEDSCRVAGVEARGKGRLVSAVVRGIVEISTIYSVEEAVKVYTLLHPLVDEDVIRSATALLKRLGWEE